MRSRLFRSAALAVASLLVFTAQQETTSFEHCPHHGGAAAQTDAMHGMSMPHHASHKGCTCIGACCAAPAIAQGSVSGGLIWVAPVVAVPATIGKQPPVPSPQPRLFPFSTAPPVFA